MSTSLTPERAGFGTTPVFLTAISTILGAVMFLRFGYAVGHVGFVGTLAVILIGHAVTIPTAMALAEIATNQKVEGGGAYYIVSRSFGIIPGAAIGIALFLSQAISVAFYVIAFAEAFRPVFEWLNGATGLNLQDARIVSLPATLLLGALVILKGAQVGMKVLYVVVAVLGLALLLFFIGSGESGASGVSFETMIRTIENPDSFFLVFAICFPAFTGMAAGVGLSGDLKNPRRSIPLGTLSATFVGMFVYVALAYKLTISATPETLANDQLIMSRIAVWGPVIPIGLACATLSSALGSAIVAPRTLQALALDDILPLRKAGSWFAAGHGPTSEPRNASIIVFAIAVLFVIVGDVNFVAQIISMFFMVTYGSICLISFLEHFAADPSYRPVFRSRWYISAFGAAACVWLMFKMSTPYAIVSIVAMAALYAAVSVSNSDRRGLASIFQGAIFQISRQLQVFLQKSSRDRGDARWRPSVVCISRSSFERQDVFDLLRWIAHRFGFGTYIHLIEGYLSKATVAESREVLSRLVRLTHVSRSNIYVDTLISPSYTTAVCQVAQLPGISGKENNLILFEFARDDPQGLRDIADNYRLVVASGFDVCILSSADRDYGYCSEIHIWITPEDYENASLMILLSYIILGHPDWKRAQIKLFALFPEGEIEAQRERLVQLIVSGRLPISVNNIQVIPRGLGDRKRDLIQRLSRDADLIITGFVGGALARNREQVFGGYEGLGNLLFVNTTKDIPIQREEDEAAKEASAKLAGTSDEQPGEKPTEKPAEEPAGEQAGKPEPPRGSLPA